MVCKLGRGLVKHSPQSRHCTTANHRPLAPALRSGASSKGDQLGPPHNGQAHSSHSMPFDAVRARACSSRAKNPMASFPGFAAFADLTLAAILRAWRQYTDASEGDQGGTRNNAEGRLGVVARHRFGFSDRPKNPKA